MTDLFQRHRTLVGRLMRLGAMLAITACLHGCASFSDDGGFDKVDRLLAERGLPKANHGPVMQDAVDKLLAHPLCLDDAVALALLNNPELQANYAELGIAEADLVQAGRLSNPSLRFARLRTGDGVDIERSVLLPIMQLLTMPQARQRERQHFAQVQLRAAGAALRIADATRQAYIGALASQQAADYFDQVKQAAETSSELAQRMVKAGNWSALRLAREQAFLADAVAQQLRAAQQQLAQREQLTRLLGLPHTRFTLPERLPDLPAAARTLSDAEAQAMSNRIDVMQAQNEAAALADNLGLVRVTGFVDLFELGYVRNSEAGLRRSGPEISLQLPLFDWSGARVARAESIYRQSLQRAAATAIDARSQVREAYARYHSAWTLARHYRDQVIPLKKRIADEQMLRYNGMLISVFELLADAREQVQSVTATIEAERDFWLADSALQAALSGAGNARMSE